MTTMASTFTMSRGHLIYGLCLPLALLIGYLLAEPLESGSLAVVVMVLSVLVTPLLMKWYHPVLVFTWNSTFYLPFLPGHPPAWIGLVALGAVFMLLNRCVDPGRRLLAGGPVAWSLITLAIVIVITAIVTGGIGLQIMGSTTFGGRKYVELGFAIIGFFVLTSQRVPLKRAGLYAGLLFLSGASTLLAELAFRAGIPFQFLLVQPITITGNIALYSNVERLTGIVSLSAAVCIYVAVRYGMAGLLNPWRPWRLLIAGAFLVAGMYGGFRSFVGFIVLVYLICFFLEHLHRTSHLPMAILAGSLCVVGLAAFGTRLPLSVQRSLSFLPIQVSPAAAATAQDTLNWRFDMWREVVQDVPRYFFKGKGYVINPTELYFSTANSFYGFDLPSEWAIVSGDYHNGPLSVLIPFGIWGALAFAWFAYASIQQLWHYCKYGNPALLHINRVLLACFVARLFFFLFLVGGINSDLPYFVSLIGLGICLNGPLPKREAAVPVEAPVTAIPRTAF